MWMSKKDNRLQRNKYSNFLILCGCPKSITVTSFQIIKRGISCYQEGEISIMDTSFVFEGMDSAYKKIRLY